MCEVPIPHHISSSNSFLPYFNGCIGALDGTHIPVPVPKARCTAFWNQKGEMHTYLRMPGGKDLQSWRIAII